MTAGIRWPTPDDVSGVERHPGDRSAVPAAMRIWQLNIPLALSQTYGGRHRFPGRDGATSC